MPIELSTFLRTATLVSLATTVVPRPAHGIPTPRLHVEGNSLRDPAGNRVVLRGVATVPPADIPSRGGFAVMAQRVTEPNLCTRVVRVPVPNASWNANYLSTYLKPYVDALTSRGVYVIIDYHAISTYQGEDSAVRSFWSAVAPAFKDYGNVLYEVFNEPTSPGGSASAWSTWKTTAQPWVDLIRSLAPETVILVASPTWCQDTRFAEGSPFTGPNLMYVAHVYPQHTNWDSLFGNASAKIPIFLSEWGYQGDGSSGPETRGTTSGYGTPMRAYLEAHPDVSWTAWIYDHSWWPVMVDSSFNLRGGENYQGVFVRDYLQEKCNSDLPATTLGGAGGRGGTSVGGATSGIGGVTAGGARNSSGAGGATTGGARSSSGASATIGIAPSAGAGAAGTSKGNGGATSVNANGGAPPSTPLAGGGTSSTSSGAASPTTGGALPNGSTSIAGNRGATPTTADDSGCGCRLGRKTWRAAWLVPLAVALLSTRRRRMTPPQTAERR